MDNRGGDSYGVAKRDKEGKIKVWRGLGRAVGSLRLDSVSHTDMMMLHTRKRTHGAISLANAHPLQERHILGVHNGIVSNHDELNQKYNRNFELDSRHIFAHLAGGFETKDIEVYGAISYLNLNDPTKLNLVKLSGAGDLVVYGIGNNAQEVQGCVFASTKDCILGALTALQLPNFAYDVDPQVQYFINEDGKLMKLAKKLEFTTGYKGTTYTCGANAATRQVWNRSNIDNDSFFPSGFSLCIACEAKKRRMTAVKQSFEMVNMCEPCWKRLAKIKYPTMYLDFNHNAKGSKKSKCIFSGCPERVHIEDRGVKFCKKHFDEIEKQKQEALKPVVTSDASSSDSPVTDMTALMKPGQDMQEVRDDSYEEEGEDDYEDRPFPRWQLCQWCDAIVRQKAEPEFNVSDLCPGCHDTFSEMLKKFVRGVSLAYAPMIWCKNCEKCPTFMVAVQDMRTAYCGPCSRALAKAKRMKLLPPTDTRPICEQCKCEIKAGEKARYSVARGQITEAYHQKFCWEEHRKKLTGPAVVM